MGNSKWQNPIHNHEMIPSQKKKKAKNHKNVVHEWKIKESRIPKTNNKNQDNCIEDVSFDYEFFFDDCDAQTSFRVPQLIPRNAYHLPTTKGTK